jgi:hypothetical protein
MNTFTAVKDIFPFDFLVGEIGGGGTPYIEFTQKSPHKKNILIKHCIS